MSRQQTLEQQRAQAAWGFVQEAKGTLGDKQKEYGQLARSAPADIQSNGLGQTLAFLRSKGFDKGGPKSGDQHALLFQHISSWTMQRMGLKESNLLQWIIDKATSQEYRRAANESMALLIWLKRFAEAELGGE